MTASYNRLLDTRGLTLILFFILLETSCCFLHTGVVLSSFSKCSTFDEKVSLHPLANAETNPVFHYVRNPTQRFAASISVEQYQHKDFKMTYLYKKAAPGRENDDPIIMVHPVGVGLSSWFWIRVMESFQNNPPLYAPDLIGCGLDHGADSWDPEKVKVQFSFCCHHPCHLERYCL